VLGVFLLVVEVKKGGNWMWRWREEAFGVGKEGWLILRRVEMNKTGL